MSVGGLTKPSATGFFFTFADGFFGELLVELGIWKEPAGLKGSSGFSRLRLDTGLVLVIWFHMNISDSVIRCFEATVFL